VDKKSQSLTAAELFERLQCDTLLTAVPVSVVGMVKKSEGKEKTIQFAPQGNCGNWVTIPLELIEDAEILGTVPCKDHAHPLVRLDLKTPTTPEGKIFAALLKATQSTFQEMPPSYPPAMAPAFAARQAVDQWGDPICGQGTKKRCYPAVCPNPSGHGSIWCTICRCEPVFNPHPEGFLPHYIY
jgi:hypothetical protein